VRLYYDKNADGKIQVDGPNADIFLGQATAIPLDGNSANPTGYWQITSALDLNQIAGVPLDGLRRLLATAEDVAGNPTPTGVPGTGNDFHEITNVASLQIFIDTQGPQITSMNGNTNADLFGTKPTQLAPTPLLNSITLTVRDLPSRVDQPGTINDFLYDALVSSVATVPGNYLLVGDHVGTVVIKSITVTPTFPLQIAKNITSVTNTSMFASTGLIGLATPPMVGDYLQMTTGPATGQVRRITAFDPTTGQMTLDIPLLNLPAVGNGFTIVSFATATITLNFASPLPDDRYTLTTVDALTDPAGNRLDGESHQVEPQPPFFASGNGVAGGNFVARFTIDSHPEIGNYVSQNINIDINGNNVWDPANAQVGNDATNVDLTFNLPLETAAGAIAPGGFNVHDLLFAGKFTRTASTAPKPAFFDQLAAFGNSAELGGVFRWLIDTNGDGVVKLGTDFETTQPALANFNISGAIPIAGNFDGNAANGDEIGLYNAGKWYLDTNHNFVIDGGDMLVNSTLFGAPIVGDFDGDGKTDLAVFNNNVFSFDLANNGFGQTDATITWGFPGVLDKPVAADMDQDGITDIGLWVPGDGASVPRNVAGWYFLVSNDFATPGVPAVHTAGSVAKLSHGFSTSPFGHDIFAEFGDEKSLPIVGNFDPPVSPAALSQAATTMGDYNGNGRIDQSDYNVWKASFGSTTNLAADGNHNGAVDIGDYLVWRSHLGQAVSGGGAESLSSADAIVVADASAAPASAIAESAPVAPPVSDATDVVSPSVSPIVPASAAVTSAAATVAATEPTSTTADPNDQALLLLFDDLEAAPAASTAPNVANPSSGSAAEEDGADLDAEALAVAWQSWGDL
jgi:hypothetical protein